MVNITGLRVAILITDGFEQVEMLKPREVLDQAGAKTSIVSSNHLPSRNSCQSGRSARCGLSAQNGKLASGHLAAAGFFVSCDRQCRTQRNSELLI